MRERKKVTDRRLVEACEGMGVDIDKATPKELLEAYFGWEFGDHRWADVILDIAENAGFKIG